MTDYGLDAPPALATLPTPGARHELRQIELIARVLGVPLMPWQRYVARVASEKHPDNPQRYRYRTIVLTVPRQSGKTTLMRAILTQRALMNSRRKAFYTAQTGKDATARWKDLIAQIEDSFLGEYTDTRMAQGSQSLTFANGSYINPFAPTPKSLHGYTPDDVQLDEIFEWSEEQGEMLMGAVKPAQQTRVGRQLWLVSTMGTEDSTFLNNWLEKGRESLNDPASEIAYFEWSLAPGLDAYDPANWDFHPAIGHTINKEDLQEASGAHSEGEWNRAYMNRRTKTVNKWIDDATLEAATGELSAPENMRDVHLAWEVDPKPGGGAGIVAAWKNGGKIHAKIYMMEPERGWIVAAAKDALTLQPGSIKYDNTAMNRHYAGDMGTDHIEPIGTQDYVTACMMLLEKIETGEIVLEDSEILREQLQNVTTKPLGEGWAISRKLSSGDVSLAVALAVAVKNAAHEVVKPAPMIRY